jgi:hypothetical protein
MTNYIATKPEDEATRERMSRHPLLNATPAQIETWVDNNVTDLASAKEALKLLAKAVAFGARKISG